MEDDDVNVIDVYDQGIKDLVYDGKPYITPEDLEVMEKEAGEEAKRAADAAAAEASVSWFDNLSDDPDWWQKECDAYEAMQLEHEPDFDWKVTNKTVPEPGLWEMEFAIEDFFNMTGFDFENPQPYVPPPKKEKRKPRWSDDSSEASSTYISPDSSDVSYSDGLVDPDDGARESMTPEIAMAHKSAPDRRDWTIKKRRFLEYLNNTEYYNDDGPVHKYKKSFYI